MPARWVDTGQSFETMAHEAARLIHPEGTHEEHAEIAKAVVADRPPPKDLSKKAKAATKTLRDNSTPTGLWGKYIYRLHGIAADAHADQTDKSGRPYIEHVEAVADSVSDEAKPVALFHDALEDTELSPEMLRDVLTEKGGATPEQAQEMVDAIKLLTRPADRTEARTSVTSRASRTRRAARASLRAKSSTPISSTTWVGMTPEIEHEAPHLRPNYTAALKTLSPEREPITQRGEAENIGRVVGKDAKGKLVREELDPKVVYDRLEKLYEASVAAGTAEAEKHWYSDAHDQIEALAQENGIDPHTLAAMVAATSPQ